MEWINVKESLPEKGTYVLVYLKKTYGGFKMEVDHVVGNLNGKLDFKKNWGNVSFWMELPKLP